MKTIKLIAMLGILATVTGSGCIKNTNTTLVNSGNNGNPLDSPNNTATGAFINLQGTINNAAWVDGSSYYGIASTTTVRFHWSRMPANYQKVGIDIRLYDGATHTVELMNKVIVTTTDTFYNAYLTTGDFRLTNTQPGWLTVTVTPLAGSGKQNTMLTANLYR